MGDQPTSPRVADSRLVVLCSAPAVSREDLERWAREQLPVLRSASGVRDVSLRRVSPASAKWSVDWHWAFELRVDRDALGDLCDRGACGDLLADMRLLGMRPVAMLLDCDADRAR